VHTLETFVHSEGLRLAASACMHACMHACMLEYHKARDHARCTHPRTTKNLQTRVCTYAVNMLCMSEQQTLQVHRDARMTARCARFSQSTCEAAEGTTSQAAHTLAVQAQKQRETKRVHTHSLRTGTIT